MSSSIPMIQVLSRQNYEDQHIVSLPNSLPLPGLAPSSVRVRSSILSISTNNLTYARVGHFFGWWNFYPLPNSIPTEFSDPNAYGRIAAWGYGTVIESTSAIEVGTQIFGYLPIGTLPVDWLVDFNNSSPGRFQVVDEYRANLLSVYNQYFFYPKALAAQDKKEDQGYDSLVRVLFETSYLVNRFVLAWKSSELAHPAGTGEGWTFDNAQVGRETVLIFAASAKTSLALAHQLKYHRPANERPRIIVAIGSNNSRAFTEGTELYDHVLNYGADDGDLGQELGLTSKSKVTIFEFGSRGEAAFRWAEKLKKVTDSVILIQGAGEVIADNPAQTAERFERYVKAGSIFLNASPLREAAIKLVGEERYFDDFYKAWNQFKSGGGVKGLGLVWGQGMKELGQGWERLCEGKVGPEEGLVFSL